MGVDRIGELRDLFEILFFRMAFGRIGQGKAFALSRTDQSIRGRRLVGA